MGNTFYKIELSNNESFNTTKFEVHNDRNRPNISHLAFHIIMGTTNYEQLKAKIAGDIDSITVKEYRQTSPDNYVSAPQLINTIEYGDSFVDTPSVEASITGEFIVRFFYRTDECRLRIKQAKQIADDAAAIVDMYETASNESEEDE